MSRLHLPEDVRYRKTLFILAGILAEMGDEVFSEIFHRPLD